MHNCVSFEPLSIGVVNAELNSVDPIVSKIGCFLLPCLSSSSKIIDLESPKAANGFESSIKLKILFT